MNTFKILDELHQMNVSNVPPTSEYGRAFLMWAEYITACQRSYPKGHTAILVGGFDKQPLDRHDTDRQSVYGRHARFARDAKTLFDIDDETRH